MRSRCNGIQRHVFPARSPALLWSEASGEAEVSSDCTQLPFPIIFAIM